MMITSAILTISDLGSQGKREDTSGKRIAEILLDNSIKILYKEIVPDEIAVIQQQLIHWTESDKIDLIVTTGGTGLSPRDVTPEATYPILERHVPGISEIIRLKTHSINPMSIISRGVSGIRNNCLIINLPGSTQAVKECMEVIIPIIPHAIDLMQGNTSNHPKN